MNVILSTKKLSKSQIKIFENSGFTIVDENFIQTKSIKFQLNKINDFLLFTSKNAVKSVVKSDSYSSLKKIKCFCIGIKTKQYLEKKGFSVIFHSNYASELGEAIKTNYKKNSFTFFSGNIRKDTLPNIFKANGIINNEIKTYETILTSKKINKPFKGILFFSPSGVKSYLEKNIIENKICFCIGTTTAKSLKNKSNNIIIAQEQTIDCVIKTAISHMLKAKRL